MWAHKPGSDGRRRLSSNAGRRGLRTQPNGRFVNHLGTSDFGVTPETCALLCNSEGFDLIGLTQHGPNNPPPMVYCYCGNHSSPLTKRVDGSLCDTPCPANPSESCGSSGHMLAFNTTCSGLPPPGPPAPPLPPGPACSQNAAKAWLFCNASAPLDDRVWDLVKRIPIQYAGGQLTARRSPALPWLGIPSFYWGSNVNHGLTNNFACDGEVCPTSFPSPLALAASFNESTWRNVGAVTGVEMRAVNNLGLGSPGLTAWGPTINIIRDPRWGRNQETPTECPTLASRYGAAMSRGIQEGEDSRYRLAIATLKHFTGYSLEDYDNHTWQRKDFNAVISKYDLAATYYPGFAGAIRDGGALGIMYAVNEVNGVPSTGSSTLFQALEAMGFDG